METPGGQDLTGSYLPVHNVDNTSAGKQLLFSECEICLNSLTKSVINFQIRTYSHRVLVY